MWFITSCSSAAQRTSLASFGGPLNFFVSPIQPMISKLLQTIGIQTSLSKDWPSLSNEGLVFRQDNTFATLKFDNFASPGAYFSKKIKVTLCNIVISKSRIYVCGWFFKIINIPCSKDNINLFSFTQTNERISIVAQAEACGDRFSGNFSISFTAKNASNLMKHFNSLKTC